jgi:hypothetical protein
MPGAIASWSWPGANARETPMLHSMHACHDGGLPALAWTCHVRLSTTFRCQCQEVTMLCSMGPASLHFGAMYCQKKAQAACRLVDDPCVRHACNCFHRFLPVGWSWTWVRSAHQSVWSLHCRSACLPALEADVWSGLWCKVFSTLRVQALGSSTLASGAEDGTGGSKQVYCSCSL